MADLSHQRRLTEAHKPEAPTEKARIEQAGGEVVKRGDIHRLGKENAMAQGVHILTANRIIEHVPGSGGPAVQKSGEHLHGRVGPQLGPFRARHAGISGRLPIQ